MGGSSSTDDQVVYTIDSPRGVIKELCSRYPEITDRLRSTNTVLIEVGIRLSPRPMERQDVCMLVKTVEDAIQEALDQVGVLPEDTQILLVGNVSFMAARWLVTQDIHTARGTVVGFLGYGEGGTDFYGCDGTRISGGEWESARDHLLSLLKKATR